jgi:hypothetical protein
MVAALEAPPRARTAAERRAAARIVPLRLVPDYGIGSPGEAERVDRESTRREPVVKAERVVTVHRRPRPRVTRSTGVAVFWRRRLIAAALGLGIVLAATHAGAALGGTTTTTPERSPHVQRVIVQPGDTLWSIARKLAPDMDPRIVVDKMVAARGSADVQPGEAVDWPS